MVGLFARYEYKAQTFSRREKLLLAIIILAGLALRIAYQWERPWYDDEVGTIRLIHKSYQYILTHFETWLTMHYFLVMTKFISETLAESVYWLGLVPLLAGMLTVPLTARLGSRFMEKEMALAAAFLVAVHPYLIQYSCIARSYSLLVFLSLLTIDQFFEWRNRPGYRQGALLGLTVFLLLMFHINGIYVVASLAFLGLADLISRYDKSYAIRAMKTLVIPVIISVVFVFLAYLPFAKPMLKGGEIWHDRPPTSVAYVPYIFGDYFGKGFLGWLPAILLFYGLAASIRHGLRVLVLIPLVVFPVIFMSLQGLSHFPWAYGRFIIFIVPILVLFMVQGIGSLLANLPSGKLTPYFIWGPVIVLALLWTPGVADLYQHKNDYPWKRVAEDLKEKLRYGDSIICDDELVSLHLEPYFPKRKFPGKLLGKFLRQSQPKDGDSIFFVSSGIRLASAGPVTRSGKIYIVGYSGQREEFMKDFRNDLEQTLKKGEIDPTLANFYHHLYQLNELLDDRNDNLENYIKWQSSYLLTNRVMNMPNNRLERMLRSEEP